MKTKIVLIASLLFVLLAACSPSVSPITPEPPTKTPVISITATSTFTSVPPTPTIAPSATLAPSATPTTIPSPTPEPTKVIIPLQIGMKSADDWKNAPEVTMDQLTSGQLSETIKNLMASGEIKPLGSEAYLCERFEYGVGRRSWDSAYFFPDGDCLKYFDNFTLLPTTSVALAKMVVEEQTIYVVASIWLNGDGTYGTVFYGYQSLEYKAVSNCVYKLFTGNGWADPVGKLVNSSFSYTGPNGCGLELPKHPAMVTMYTTDQGGEKRTELLKTWATQRIVPVEAEKILFLGYINGK